MTTTVATTASPRARAGSDSLFAGTGTLLRLFLRRDRIYIPAWVLGITSLQVAGAAAYPDIYPEEADRAVQAAVVGGNPAMRALTGPGHGIDNYTYGAMMGNEYLGFMAIIVALMSVFLMVRHTRAEEEAGRLELLRANVTGRHAPLAAALLTAGITNLGLGLLMTVGMAGLGIESIDWTGSAVFGAAYAMVGLVFAGIAAVTAQLTEHSRAASGIAGASIGVAYLIRAIGDVEENGLSWLSPIGWAQASAPYVDNVWWPLALGVAVFAALAIVAFALTSRRDLGAGFVRQRPGRSTATRLLGTPLGFAWRLQRAATFWWCVAMLLFGAAYGSALDVIDNYTENETVAQIAATVGGASLIESWLTLVITLFAIGCTIYAVSAALRPRREETSGRAEAVLATALSRTWWVGTHLVVAMVGGVVVLAFAGLGLGLGTVATRGDSEYLWEVFGAAVAYAPALWLTTGIAVAAVGIHPRAALLAWAMVGYAFLVTYLGGLLDLPQWMYDLSPFNHVPHMPTEEFALTPLLVLTGITAGLVAIGLVGFRRRDLQTG